MTEESCENAQIRRQNISNSQNLLQLGLVLRPAVKRNFYREQYINFGGKVSCENQSIVPRKKTEGKRAEVYQRTLVISCLFLQ